MKFFDSTYLFCGLIFILSLNTGCLVPGAPQHFYFHKSDQKQCDKLKAISYSNDIEYYYKPCELNIDSIFLFEPKLSAFKKMVKRIDENDYRYSKSENIINGNLKRMKKLHSLVVKKYTAGKFSLDTLKLIPSLPTNLK